MTYIKIDKILQEWSKRHGLHWITKSPYDDDVELRDTNIVDDSGEIFKLGVKAPDADEKVSLWVSDDPNRSLHAGYQNKSRTEKNEGSGLNPYKAPVCQ